MTMRPGSPRRSRRRPPLSCSRRATAAASARSTTGCSSISGVLRCRWSWSATSRRRPWRAPLSNAVAGSTRRPSASRSRDFPAEQQRLLRFFPGLLPKSIAERCALDPSAAALIPAGPAHFLIPPGYRDIDPATAAPALDAMEAAGGARRRVQGARRDLLHRPFRRQRAAQRACLPRLPFRRDRPRPRTGGAGAERRPHTGSSCHRRPRPPGATPLPASLHGDFRDAGAFAARAGAASRRACIGPPPRGTRARRTHRRTGRARRGHLQTRGRQGRSRRSPSSVAPCRGTDCGRGGRRREGARRNGRRRCGPDRRRAPRFCLRDEPRRAGPAERRPGGGATRTDPSLRHQRRCAEPRRDRGDERRLGPHRGGPGLACRARARGSARRSPGLPSSRSKRCRSAAVEAVLGTVSVPRVQLDQSVSEAIAAALQRAMPGLAAPDEKDAPLPSIRLSGNGGDRPDAGDGGPGAAVLWSTRKAEGQPPSPPRLALLALAWTALRQLCPAAETAESGTILVDDNAGLDLPSTRNAALSMALRAGVAEVCFGEERIALDCRHSAAPCRRPSRRPVARDCRDRRAAGCRWLGRRLRRCRGFFAVTAPAGALRARFRRHLDDTTLSGREAEILAPIRDRGRMPLGSLAVLLGMPLTETERLLRGLEARRIVRVDFEGR